MMDILFPRHLYGLTLAHNEYKVYDQTLLEWEEEIMDRFGCVNDTDGHLALGWVSLEQRTKAIAMDSLWLLQWYPKTPIGFYRLLACDLDVLLKAAKELEDNDTA